jgi:hypothetical protein
VWLELVNIDDGQLGGDLAVGRVIKAGMAELADAADSKSADRKVVGVRPPLPAPASNISRISSLENVQIVWPECAQLIRIDSLKDYWFDWQNYHQHTSIYRR